MGKHSAADDSTVDPLVADALASRSAEPHSGQHEGADRPGQEGDLGWPGEPAPEGGGLGWPTGSRERADAALEDASPDTAPAGQQVEYGVAPTGPRRGWRRLFGASPAA